MINTVVVEPLEKKMGMCILHPGQGLYEEESHGQLSAAATWQVRAAAA
jgi:hypothetical protein